MLNRSKVVSCISVLNSGTPSAKRKEGIWLILSPIFEDDIKIRKPNLSCEMYNFYNA